MPLMVMIRMGNSNERLNGNRTKHKKISQTEICALKGEDKVSLSAMRKFVGLLGS